MPTYGLYLSTLVHEFIGIYVRKLSKLIVVCNTASRAVIEAQAFKQMGFKTVKIYEINKWIDECNPVITKYSAGEHKDGTKTKFGNYYAEHCKK